MTQEQQLHRLASTFLRTGAAISAGLLVYGLVSLGRTQVDAGWLVSHLAMPGASLVTMLGILRLRGEARVKGALAILATGCALFGAEIFLLVRQNPYAAAAERRGRSYDGRDWREVVRDLRQQGAEAWPVVAPRQFLSGEFEGAFGLGRDLLALGGIANKLTAYCNETGKWATYRSDERGFRNPPGIWSRSPITLAAVGDSFTHGACVDEGEDVVSRLRRVEPSALNLGYGGNGPLLELAAIREYLIELKPQHVLWMFAEKNDLGDLEIERSVPLLTQYLQSSQRQNLPGQQPEIDRRLMAFANTRLAEHRFNPMSPTFNKPLCALKLCSLRELAFGAFFEWQQARQPGRPPDFLYFREVLRAARDTVRSWNGELIFVFLPAPLRYFDESVAPVSELYRQRVLEIARELDIPSVDIHHAFAASGDPRRFLVDPPAHYNAEGYLKTADTILSRLR